MAVHFYTGKKQHENSAKILLLCPTEDKVESYTGPKQHERVNNVQPVIFERTVPLNAAFLSLSLKKDGCFCLLFAL